MSSISSRQIRNYASADILSTVALIVVLAMLALLDSHVIGRNSSGAAFYQNQAASNGIGSGDQITFTSDEQYWSANCSHGWKSDATCESILLRAKVCDLGADTAYCSEYDTYIQQIREQVKRQQYFPAQYDV